MKKRFKTYSVSSQGICSVPTIQLLYGIFLKKMVSSHSVVSDFFKLRSCNDCSKLIVARSPTCDASPFVCAGTLPTAMGFVVGVTLTGIFPVRHNGLITHHLWQQIVAFLLHLQQHKHRCFFPYFITFQYVSLSPSSTKSSAFCITSLTRGRLLALSQSKKRCSCVPAFV